MTAEASGGHEDLLDYDKERASHELLTMPTAGEAASNGYIRRRPGPTAQAASNGFVVVDGQSREDADDETTYDLDEPQRPPGRGSDRYPRPVEACTRLRLTEATKRDPGHRMLEGRGNNSTRRFAFVCVDLTLEEALVKSEESQRHFSDIALLLNCEVALTFWFGEVWTSPNCDHAITFFLASAGQRR
ncbi:hypothetical protein LSAT2_015408 [Lamellibrachia satsuma]|nr:hypothetical protein LSAT2_015408 [Lamellibrachia satsuma]